MSDPKIIVMKRKYLIICASVALIILIAILLAINAGSNDMGASALSQNVQSTFNAKADNTEASNASYVPGVYTYVFSLNDTYLNMEVIVDENHINSVSITNLDETVTTMYPLINPSLEDIEAQLILDCEIDDLALPESSKYTSLLLINAIEHALDKAAAH